MSYISAFAIPAIIGLFIAAGVLKHVNVYECFADGAKDGLDGLIGIIPPLVGLMVAIYMFRAAGIPETTAKFLSPFLQRFGIPQEVLPLTLLRPISGSASVAVVTDIFKRSGPDSAAGKMASVMMGSTETTFYVLTVYFGAVGIKNSRHTVAAALIADICSMIAAAVFTNFFLI